MYCARILIVSGILLHAVCSGYGNELPKSGARDGNTQTLHMYLSASYDFSTSFTTISHSDLGGMDVKDGITVSGEIIYDFPQNDQLKAGIGMEYQLYREFQDDPANRKFSFLPIYASVYIFPTRIHNSDFFINAELGRNIHRGNDEYKTGRELKNGGHYGLGLGCIAGKRYIFECELDIDSGGRKTISQSGQKDLTTSSVYYTKSSFRIGLIF